MTAPQSIIAELQASFTCGSEGRRVETLRRVTDLFFEHAERLNEQQIGLFDDVLGRMIDRIEARAVAELSGRMAPLANAPLDLVRRLARHDAIEVAAPILETSPRLDQSDLIEIAQSRGDAHLVAISRRSELMEPVTDVLLRRGGAPVFHTLAANAGARFSDSGFDALVGRSRTDEHLAETVGMRPDLPDHRLEQLLGQATDEVRRRLSQSTSPDRAAKVEAVVAAISKDMRRPERDYSKAKALIAIMQSNGALNKASLAEFVNLRRFEETVVALSALCGSRLELVVRILETGRYDGVLIVCKAAGLGWPTVRSILETRPGHQMGSAHDLDRAAQEYEGLTDKIAQRVLRFWQVRQTVKAQPSVQDAVGAERAAN